MTPKPTFPESSVSFAKTTSATLIAALPRSTTFHTMRTVRSGADVSTRRTPSATSRQWPRVSDSSDRRRLSGMRATRIADTRNVAAFTTYGTDGLHMVSMRPPATGPIIQATVSTVWRSEFAFVSSSSGTRFGRPA